MTQHTATPAAAAVQESPLLAPGTVLLHREDGWVLQTADGAQHAVLLPPADIDALLDALLTGTTPRAALARRALDALIAAGHATAPGADESVRGVRVAGTGDLAAAVTGALEAMGVTPDLPVTPVGFTVHLLDEAPHSGGVTRSGLTCWLEGHLLVLAPVAVSAPDTAARRRATGRPAPPLPGDRAVVSARPVLSPRARVVAAALIAAEAVHRLERGRRPRPLDRDDHLATVLDLRTLRVTRHPVLPVPRPPS